MSNITFFEYPDPIVWWQVVLYFCGVAWGGFVIGCFGVGGGVAFVPLMMLLPGMDGHIDVAVGSVFVGVIIGSFARSYQLYRYGRLRLRESAPLMVGGVVGGITGQAILPLIPSEVLVFVVAFLAILAGAQAVTKALSTRRPQRAPEGHSKPGELRAPSDARLPVQEPGARSTGGPLGAEPPVAPAGATVFQGHRSAPVADLPQASALAGNPVVDNGASADGHAPPEAGGHDQQPDKSDRKQGLLAAWSRPWLAKHGKSVGIGFVASLLSSLTGTGGPLMLFPIYFFMEPDIEVKRLVGISSAFSLALVCSSAVGAFTVGSVDFGMAAVFSAVFAVAILAGGVCMERLGDSILKLLVGAALVIIGIVIAVKTAVGLLVE